MANPILNKLLTLFHKKLFPSIVIGMLISAFIQIGVYLQLVIFQYFNGIQGYYLHDTYSSFPSYLEFIKTNAFELIIVGALICLPCLYVKKTKLAFYTGVISSILFITLYDLILLIPNVSQDKIFESIISNTFGSPILSALTIYFIRTYNTIEKSSLFKYLIPAAQLFFFTLSYLVVMFICYMLLFFIDKPTSMEFKVKLNDEFRGIYKKTSKDSSLFAIGEKNTIGNDGISFYGDMKEISLIKNSESSNLNFRLAFFENCNPDIKIEPPKGKYLDFNNINMFKLDSPLFQDNIMGAFYSSNKISSYHTENTGINVFNFKDGDLQIAPYGKESALNYIINSKKTKLFLYYHPFMKKTNENFEHTSFNIKMDGAEKNYNFNIQRLKNSKLNSPIMCKWIDFKDKDIINLDASITLGVMISITKNDESYLYLNPEKIDSIKLDDFLGFITLKEISKLNEYITAGKVNNIQLQDISNLTLDGKTIDINKNSMIVITSNNINGYFDENLIFYGNSSYIYLDGKRLNQTLWEKLDSFSAIITAISGLLLSTFIYIFRKFIKLYKNNKELN